MLQQWGPEQRAPVRQQHQHKEGHVDTNDQSQVRRGRLGHRFRAWLRLWVPTYVATLRDERSRTSDLWELTASLASVNELLSVGSATATEFSACVPAVVVFKSLCLSYKFKWIASAVRKLRARVRCSRRKFSLWSSMRRFLRARALPTWLQFVALFFSRCLLILCSAHGNNAIVDGGFASSSDLSSHVWPHDFVTELGLLNLKGYSLELGKIFLMIFKNMIFHIPDQKAILCFNIF